jgi:hypothetical protein
MKILLSSMALLILMSCSSKQASWDEGGAQKQEAMEDAARSDQQDHIRDQNPGDRNF